MTSTPRTRARRAFTIVEMAVTLAVLGLVLAFTLPKVVGTATFAEDEKAQATASGAMDTIAQRFTDSLAANGKVPFEASTCTDPKPSPAARRLTDRDHILSPAEQTAVASGTYQPGPLTATGYTQTVSGSNGALTNCPVFADPASLAAGNGDVKFTSADKPSTDSSTASVAAWVIGGTRWRVGVTVLAPQKDGTVASCWMVWRDFPFAGQNGTARERYFVNTTVSATDPTDCQGLTLPAWDTDTGTTLCRTPDGNLATADAGTSWRRACGNYR